VISARGLALLAMALGILGCTQGAPRAPSNPPAMAGYVTAIDPAGDRIGSIRVEERPGESAGSAKAVVRIMQGTEITRGDSARAEFRSLAKGQWVRVWFTGPVRESYPLQADASFLVIDSLGR
jgi:hypothetical protein